MQPCTLCDQALAPVLAESQYWRLILNLNQNLLGKSFLVLRRHLEVVSNLTPDEWLDLHQQIRIATARLTRAFTPDHFNYAFLQNQDRHIHLHIIPRYAGTREVAGLVFDDVDYPAHYAVPAPARRLAPQQQAAIVLQLQQRAE
jgi:diadenosine tetraphosphate (Ap4A) HIT family hydrolase